MSVSPPQFQTLILQWFDQYGRKHLPWQQNKTPYRVWISEIMLQQTQVNTVIPYFERFMQHFPDVLSLANGHEDEVLHLWAGLGYYSRARNLHRAAKIIMENYQGKFPDTDYALQKLPGIGQSTAGAILSIAFNQQAAILDGNVKRVLSRFYGVIEPINEKSIENKLWDIAIKHTPAFRTADYAQAMMDLGATLCTRGKPQCTSCPLSQHCAAYHQDLTASIPKKKAARKLPIRTATFLILRKGKRILLQKRPAEGIWGGLWSVPDVTGNPDENFIRQFCQKQFHLAPQSFQSLPAFRHTFSHYHLDIFPILITIDKAIAIVMEDDKQIWYNPQKPEPVGLPKPIQTLLRRLP